MAFICRHQLSQTKWKCKMTAQFKLQQLLRLSGESAYALSYRLKRTHIISAPSYVHMYMALGLQEWESESNKHSFMMWLFLIKKGKWILKVVKFIFCINKSKQENIISSSQLQLFFFTLNNLTQEQICT